MSSEIFRKMISVNFSHHVDDMPDDLKRIATEMNARGLYFSGGAMKSYAKEANDRKKDIAEKMKGLLESFWSDNKDKSIDLPTMAFEEAKSLYLDLDSRVLGYLRKPGYVENVQAVEDIENLLYEENDKSLKKIKDTAEIVFAGFSPTPVAKKAGDDIDINVGGHLVVNSQIYGSLVRDIGTINESDPAIANAFNTLLKAFDEEIKTENPEAYKESVEVLSGLAEEVKKPEGERRKGIIKAILDRLEEVAQYSDKYEKVRKAIGSFVKFIAHFAQ